MNALWAVPAVVVSIGAAGVYALARSAMEEMRELAREVGRLGDARPALVAVRTELEAARESLGARGRR